MSLSPQFLDELRARTQLSALLARSLKLTRAGAHALPLTEGLIRPA